MTFSVTITGVSAPIEVYGGLAACDDYLIAAAGEGAAAYQEIALELDPDGEAMRPIPENDPRSDVRKRLLVSATRWIDGFPFAGAATGEGGTTLQVPRSGLALSSAEQLALVARATFEAVAILAADGDAAAAVDTGSNIRVLDADGTKIEFFRPTSAADGTAPTLPPILTRILGPLLGGGASGTQGAFAGASHGTRRDSSFDDCDAFRLTRPF